MRSPFFLTILLFVTMSETIQSNNSESLVGQKPLKRGRKKAIDLDAQLSKAQGEAEKDIQKISRARFVVDMPVQEYLDLNDALTKLSEFSEGHAIELIENTLAKLKELNIGKPIAWFVWAVIFGLKLGDVEAGLNQARRFISLVVGGQKDTDWAKVIYLYHKNTHQGWVLCTVFSNLVNAADHHVSPFRNLIRHLQKELGFAAVSPTAAPRVGVTKPFARQVSAYRIEQVHTKKKKIDAIVAQP